MNKRIKKKKRKQAWKKQVEKAIMKYSLKNSELGKSLRMAKRNKKK